MSRSRVPLVLGVAAVGGVGYYLYQAGGQPKIAEQTFESDIHKAAAAIKSELPGRTSDAEKQAKHMGQDIGAKINATYAAADSKLAQAKSETEAYAKQAKAQALKKVDEFDRKVEDSAAKAKSGISSWFGGK